MEPCHGNNDGHSINTGRQQVNPSICSQWQQREHSPLDNDTCNRVGTSERTTEDTDKSAKQQYNYMLSIFCTAKTFVNI